MAKFHAQKKQKKNGRKNWQKIGKESKNQKFAGKPSAGYQISSKKTSNCQKKVGKPKIKRQKIGTVLFGLNTPPTPFFWLLTRWGVFKEHVLKMVNLDF